MFPSSFMFPRSIFLFPSRYSGRFPFVFSSLVVRTRFDGRGGIRLFFSSRQSHRHRQDDDQQYADDHDGGEVGKRSVARVRRHDEMWLLDVRRSTSSLVRVIRVKKMKVGKNEKKGKKRT